MGSDRRRLTARRACAAGCIATVVVAVAGCTTQQAYSAAQAWQRNECNRLVEQTERERCLARTNVSFDDYKRQTGDGGKP